jgi:hypothetical protein
MKIVTLFYDCDVSSPSEWGGWKLWSFSYKHKNFHARQAFLTDEGEPADIGIRRRLDTGTAFLLSYYEHSLCRWSLRGEGPSCRWDSVRTAGILLWDGNVRDLPRGYEARRESARDFCESYTAWANGEVYGYMVSEDVTLPCGHVEREILDTCGGYFSAGQLAADVREVVRGDEINVNGDARDLAAYFDLRGKSTDLSGESEIQSKVEAPTVDGSQPSAAR